MKKIVFAAVLAAIFVCGVYAADSPSLITPQANTISAAAVSVSIAAEATPFIQGIMPPAVDEGAYENPGEPAPTTEEAQQSIEKKSESRKKKHFTIEQTLYTPSSIGTKIGYFINENWRVFAEYSTISSLIANSNKEKNISWAVGGNYSPAEDDWSPFYGAGISIMDIDFKTTMDSQAVNATKDFTGGYLCAGVTWITESIFMASFEFDLYGGKTRIKKDNMVDSTKSTDETEATLSVMIGITAGVCF